MDKELIQELCRLIKTKTRLGLNSFGKREGVGRTTIYKWKYGVYGPSLRNFCKLADKLGYKLVLVKK